ncbi:wax ester synthase/diacylglycerol acyltransferase 5-like [Wolffia australiana]
MGGKSGDEPVSPAGRFFLRPEMDQVINCIVGFDNPIDVPSIKAEFQRTLLRYHPRLSCLLVKDAKGREHWSPFSKVDINDHVIVVDDAEDDGRVETFVEDYVAGLAVSSPLDINKPLWEIHLIPTRRAGILRLHHALGDGTALMSLFLASCERADDPSKPVTVPDGRRPKPVGFVALLWKAIKVAFFSLIFAVDMLLRAAWVKDDPNPITGGAGVELWPRRMCTVTFDLDDIKIIKNRSSATVNDVLVAIIASGLAKYFKLKPSKHSRDDVRITGLSMVNTRKTPGLQDCFRKIKEGKADWGNRFGFFLLPIWLQNNVHDPIEHVRQAKNILGIKKQSLEAHFSYTAGAIIMALLGPKIATLINYRIVCNTSFTLSNIVGPSEKVMFAKNPLKYLRVTASSLPHALTLHLISYNGKADLQILLAKDIIHDMETLAKCFEDAFKEMMLVSISDI